MATSFNFNLNTLQLCKCLTIPLHNSHCSYHFFAFSSHKHTFSSSISSFFLVKPPITTVINPVSNNISAVFSGLNCNSSGNSSFGKSLFYSNHDIVKESGSRSSARINLWKRNEKGNIISAVFPEKLDFRNDDESSSSSPSRNSLYYSNYEEEVDDRKSRKSGGRFNLGKRNEKGNDISAFFPSLNYNSLGEKLDFRNDDESSSFGKSLSNSNNEIVEEKVSKGVVDDSKGRKSGARIDLGKRNIKGDDRRVGFDHWGKWENNNRDSGWRRENGSEHYGKTGGRIHFGKRSEMGNEVSSSKSGVGKEMGRMDGISGNVAIDNENRGQKGSRASSIRPKDDKSASIVVNRNVHRQIIKDNNISDNDGKVKRKEKLSKKKKADTPEFQMRVGLDMCSKMGDVMGAISLYDSAIKQGVKIGQYQYTVLLYLCSSASTGVIRPAKSGSSSRVLDKVDGPNNSEEEEDDDTDTDTDYSDDKDLGVKDKTEKLEMNEIRVSDDVKKYALEKGFKIYERMCLDKVQMNEAALTSVARMAMAMGNGDMAFDMVKQMKSMGINPRLRSYSPALSVFSSNGELEKAFAVEKDMLENGVQPEEPELEALLRVSVQNGKADRVYYVLHKLRTNVRSVSPFTAALIEKWFISRQASRVGKRKWDANLLAQTTENVGGGWHGLGWLGSGKWIVSRTTVGNDGLCKCCGEILALIDLDPEETDRFAQSVASIAIKRDRNSSFQKFQRWLDYYGPFEAVVDAANVGLFSQRRFKPSKVNAVVNGIRQLLPSKKWPLIILHNKRVTGGKMGEPVNKAVVDRWRNADALYATPTGSNDDWYWLYAAIKFKCLLVTNDEMRDHTFQLLGNDFFPKWKERHQVRFSFTEIGPVFHMPPPCSVVIQESDKGFWHIPIVSEHQSEGDRIWLCISRPKLLVTQDDPKVGADPGEVNDEA